MQNLRAANMSPLKNCNIKGNTKILGFTDSTMLSVPFTVRMSLQCSAYVMGILPSLTVCLVMKVTTVFVIVMLCSKSVFGACISLCVLNVHAGGGNNAEVDSVSWRSGQAARYLR